jgi:hypothetical protein
VDNVLFDARRYEETLPLYDRSLAIDSRGVLHHKKASAATPGRVSNAVHYFSATRPLDSGCRYQQQELM